VRASCLNSKLQTFSLFLILQLLLERSCVIWFEMNHSLNRLQLCSIRYQRFSFPLNRSTSQIQHIKNDGISFASQRFTKILHLQPQDHHHYRAVQRPLQWIPQIAWMFQQQELHHLLERRSAPILNAILQECE